ncbi:hypothetical protein TWF730_003207 [Orbilia blumenaviensis]|uniref:Uncharacterized protein n=1 Tax=Orbilia blumenaviensis TaxID=1796055 RepID=A0AAV9U4V2_9PEZI
MSSAEYESTEYSVDRAHQLYLNTRAILKSLKASYKRRREIRKCLEPRQDEPWLSLVDRRVLQTGKLFNQLACILAGSPGGECVATTLAGIYRFEIRMLVYWCPDSTLRAPRRNGTAECSVDRDAREAEMQMHASRVFEIIQRYDSTKKRHTAARKELKLEFAELQTIYLLDKIQARYRTFKSSYRGVSTLDPSQYEFITTEDLIQPGFEAQNESLFYRYAVYATRSTGWQEMMLTTELTDLFLEFNRPEPYISSGRWELQRFFESGGKLSIKLPLSRETFLLWHDMFLWVFEFFDKRMCACVNAKQEESPDFESTVKDLVVLFRLITKIVNGSYVFRIWAAVIQRILDGRGVLRRDREGIEYGRPTQKQKIPYLNFWRQLPKRKGSDCTAKTGKSETSSKGGSGSLLGRMRTMFGENRKHKTEAMALLKALSPDGSGNTVSEQAELEPSQEVVTEPANSVQGQGRAPPPSNIDGQAGYAGGGEGEETNEDEEPKEDEETKERTNDNDDPETEEMRAEEEEEEPKFDMASRIWRTIGPTKIIVPENPLVFNTYGLVDHYLLVEKVLSSRHSQRTIRGKDVSLQFIRPVRDRSVAFETEGFEDRLARLLEDEEEQDHPILGEDTLDALPNLVSPDSSSAETTGSQNKKLSENNNNNGRNSIRAPEHPELVMFEYIQENPECIRLSPGYRYIGLSEQPCLACETALLSSEHGYLVRHGRERVTLYDFSPDLAEKKNRVSFYRSMEIWANRIAYRVYKASKRARASPGQGTGNWWEVGLEEEESVEKVEPVKEEPVEEEPVEEGLMNEEPANEESEEERSEGEGEPVKQKSMDGPEEELEEGTREMEGGERKEGEDDEDEEEEEECPPRPMSSTGAL